jgi:4-azaleucine resistance transporter AzlC
MLFKAGYNWMWAALISLLVYAGSGQFLLVSLISSGAGLATTALMTLFINTRHMFYGLSYIEKFKAGGWRYPFMIFTLTDETYSVNASILSVPDGVDEPRARFLIGEFDHVYWIIGSVLGSLLSAALPMDFTGIDFSMTALFVVIFIDLIRNQKGGAGWIGALGLCAGILCLLIFGADKFLLPSLVRPFWLRIRSIKITTNRAVIEKSMPVKSMGRAALSSEPSTEPMIQYTWSNSPMRKRARGSSTPSGTDRMEAFTE